MFDNPFSPVFGGRPGIFFGRHDLRRRFRVALADPSSEDRALFITGTRGSGKTTLLELFSSMASSSGWKTIDLGPDHVIMSLLHSLADYDEKTTAVNPQVSVTVLGTGGSVGGVSTSRTRLLDEADLATVFVEVCRAHPKGVMVTIDEIQKVAESDVSTICNAFQLAIRKGHNTILAIAGLPYTHAEVIRYEGCTFMRRAHHIELSLLSRMEARDALADAFAKRTPGLDVGQGELERLVGASYGHPYMLQLLGYYLVVAINERGPKKVHEVLLDEVDEAIELAVSAYEARALQPLVAELKPDELKYLQTMAHSLDQDRTCGTSNIAKALRLDAGRASYLRKRLIDNGIVLSAGYGRLMFNIPYLDGYVQRSQEYESVLERAREWGV